ncbi:TPA: GIY-YIG nuclease family protein [Escherichia coli]
MTIDEHIERFKAIHGDKYDYSEFRKAGYHGANKKILIKCRECGEWFEQLYCVHLGGHGCKKCGKRRSAKAMRQAWGTDTLLQEEFERRVREKNGNSLDLSAAVYKNAVTPVKVKCKRCGYVWEPPAQELYRRGCPVCNPVRGTPDHVYVMVDDYHNPTVMKIGITKDTHNKKERRFSAIVRHTPFHVEPDPLACWYVSPRHARKLEKEFHKLCDDLSCGFNNFDGCSEWFRWDDNKYRLIEDFITNLQRRVGDKRPKR